MKRRKMQTDRTEKINSVRKTWSSASGSRESPLYETRRLEVSKLSLRSVTATSET